MVHIHQMTVALKCNELDLSQTMGRFFKHLGGLASIEHERNISECLTFLNVTSVLFVVDASTLSSAICEDLVTFVDGGGRCALLLRGDMSKDSLSNVNYLIEQFGICGNPDVAIDCVYRQPMDPEHSTGVFSTSSIPFPFPHGCTLTVQEPANILAVTSINSYPVSQPVCAYTLVAGGGRFLVVGSSRILSDAFFTISNLEKSFVHSVLIPFLLEDVWLPPEPIPADQVPPYRLIPDLQYMVELMDELEEPEEDPTEKAQQYKPRWKSVDEDFIADVAQAYELLKVPLEPLSVSFSLDPSHFLLPALGYCPIVIEDEAVDPAYDKIPLVDLQYLVEGSPPLQARSEEEIEYALNSCDPKLALLDLAKSYVINSRRGL